MFAYSETVRSEVRKEYGWDNKLVFGHVGNFIPQKNHYFMVDIIAEAIKTEENALLLFLGRGDAMDSVREYAIKKGVAEHIVFMGSRSDTTRFYQAMDLFLFPSLYEGLPIAGIEAQTADLPCLFSDAITSGIVIPSRAVSMPLELGAAEWAKMSIALAKTSERGNVSDKIAASGYDAADMGKRMEQIYEQQ